MTRHILVPAILLLAAAPLRAQTGREYFVQPDTALDSTVVARQAPFLALRDSTSALKAAGARLMSELTSTSSVPWMHTRARAIQKACVASEAPLGAARAATTAQKDWPLAAQQQARASLLRQMATFGETLSNCEKTWAALAKDTSQTSIRESAPYQWKLLRDEIGALDRSVQAYLQATAAKLPPPGQTPR